MTVKCEHYSITSSARARSLLFHKRSPKRMVSRLNFLVFAVHIGQWPLSFQLIVRIGRHRHYAILCTRQLRQLGDIGCDHIERPISLKSCRDFRAHRSRCLLYPRKQFVTVAGISVKCDKQTFKCCAERCQHHAPLACAVAVTSDNCGPASCGGKGATLQRSRLGRQSNWL
jgi:hypothetical protein